MLRYTVSQVFQCRKSFRHCFSSVLIPWELQSSGKKSHCLTETGLSPELSASNEASLANDMNFTYFLLVSRVILGKECRAVVVRRVFLFVCRGFLFVSFVFFFFFGGCSLILSGLFCMSVSLALLVLPSLL